MFSHLRKPNFEHFQQTLFNKTNDYIPLIELGIHPDMRKAIMGKPVLSVKEEIAFMRALCYDLSKYNRVFILILIVLLQKTPMLPPIGLGPQSTMVLLPIGNHLKHIHG